MLLDLPTLPDISGFFFPLSSLRSEGLTRSRLREEKGHCQDVSSSRPLQALSSSVLTLRRTEGLSLYFYFFFFLHTQWAGGEGGRRRRGEREKGANFNCSGGKRRGRLGHLPFSTRTAQTIRRRREDSASRPGAASGLPHCEGGRVWLPPSPRLSPPSPSHSGVGVSNLFFSLRTTFAR